MRLRRRADVSVLENSENTSEKTREETDNAYHYRLRAGCEARWDTSLTLGTTIQAQGRWDDRSDDRSEPGVSEAYLGMNNIAFLPISAKLGRQSLLLGRGLLISDWQKEWSFDALDLRYDPFPYVWGLTAARTARISPDTRLEWIGLGRFSYEPQLPPLRQTTLYGGRVESYGGETFGLAGTRAELALSPDLSCWAEIAFQNGNAPSGRELAAWIGDIGAEYEFDSWDAEPVVKFRATTASGGEGDVERDFVAMMDRRIGGIVLRPILSNIQIYQLGGFCPLGKDAKLGLDIFQYRRNEAEAGVVGESGWMYEGFLTPASAESRDLGWEANISCELKTREHITLRISGGMFDLGPAYAATASDDRVFEGWIEMVWNY